MFNPFGARRQDGVALVMLKPTELAACRSLPTVCGALSQQRALSVYARMAGQVSKRQANGWNARDFDNVVMDAIMTGHRPG
jgi:hypothetical protein